MKLIRTIYTLGLLVGLFASCSKESPLDGEQYYKQVYIVGAYEVVQQFDVAYGDGPQNAYVAVATGGSQNIDRNVEVVLTHNDATIVPSSWECRSQGYPGCALPVRLPVHRCRTIRRESA